MNTLNEAAKRQTLIESLQAVAAQLNSVARVRAQPAPSVDLLEEAASQMILAAEYIEHLPPPKESD